MGKSRRLQLAVLGIVALAAAYFALPRTRPKPISLEPRASVVSLPEGYVDDALCAQCHSEILEAFSSSGMSRSWASWGEEIPVEARPESTEPFDAPPFRYRVEFRDGKQIQREWRVDERGDEWPLDAKPAHYVLGSGGHGRAYIHSDKGYLIVLPLGWYSTKGCWDLNPGYHEFNQRFTRRVVPHCMSCHASMVGHRVGSENAYAEPIAKGIGCQRCHGPGKSHMEAMERGPTDGNDIGIVRLGTLSDDLKQDVCLQCHLAGDLQVPQPGCDEWSFRPGMKIRDVRSVFFNPDKDPLFRSVGHGPRSMASACYKESDGKMTCVFCHDPHRPHKATSRPEYNAKCLDCHALQPCNRTLTPAESANDGDCVSCHMPKRESGDIVHAFATDHWIRRPSKDSIPMLADQDERGLVPFWPDTSPGQIGSALVSYGTRQGDRGRVARGVELLKAATQSSPAVGEWRLALAKGLHFLGQADQSLAESEAAIANHPKLVDAHQARALALLALGRRDEAIRNLESILQNWPDFIDGDVPLAQAYLSSGAPQRLLEMEKAYFSRHPDDPQRLELLARALRATGAAPDEITEVLDRAIAAEPTRAEAYLFRASLAIEREDAEEVEKTLTAARRAAPDSPAVAATWARFLFTQQRYLEAQAAVDELAKRFPDHEQTRQILNQLQSMRGTR